MSTADSVTEQRPAPLADPESGSNVSPGTDSFATHMNDVEVEYGSVPDLQPGDEHGRIVSVRTEFVKLGQLPVVAFMHEEHERRDLNDFPPVRSLVIERSLIGSKATVSHSYSLTPGTAESMLSLEEASSIVVEDANLLKMATMMATSGGDGSRGAALHQVRSLQRQNASLRSALGMSRTEPVNSGTVKSAVQNLQESYHREMERRKAAAAEREAEKQALVSEQTEPGIASGHGDDVHSPLQWEQETEAAVNARTRYDPYMKKTKAGEKHRLDAVTQQQLVARLHDKSVDQRDKRISDNKAKLERELGMQERRVLSLGEQHNLGTRLHDEWREHCKGTMEQAVLRYHGPPEVKKKFSPDEQKTSNDRIYRQPRDKTKRVMDKLYQQYIVDVDAKIPKRTITPDEMKAMGDRLATYNIRDYK